MNNPSQTKDMNELNNTIRHTLGWCLYSPPEKECQHLPANEDDEQTISELSTLITEQVRLGRANELRIIKSENYTSGFEFDVYRRKRLRQLKDTTLLEEEK